MALLGMSRVGSCLFAGMLDKKQLYSWQFFDVFM